MNRPLALARALGRRRWSALVLVVVGTACPGPADTLRGFDVTLRTASDCSQVGQGAVNCVDESELRQVSLSGRWVVDERPGDLFVLTTHEGRTMTGVRFPNDGSLAVTESCSGDGGTCFFARTRDDTTDPETGCLEIQERSIDAVIDPDGVLSGVVNEVRFSDEGCGTSLVTQLITDVEGEEREVLVPAREEFTP